MSRELLLSFSCANPPPAILVFYSLLLSNLPTPHSNSASTLIPSPCNTRSTSPRSVPKPQSWSDTRPRFLRSSNQAPFSCSLKSTQAGSHSSHHPDGSRGNEELLPYNRAVTSFLILQNLQKYRRSMTFRQGGQFLAGAAKGTCPRSWQMLNFCWGTAVLQILSETVTSYLTPPKECI